MPAEYVREGINARVNDNIARKITSTYVRVHPLLHMLGMSDMTEGGTVQSLLGRPDTAMVLHGPSKDKAEVMRKYGSTSRQCRIVKDEPDDTVALESGGVTPVASQSATENIGTYETRWTHIQTPLELDKHDLEAATNAGGSAAAEAVGNIVDESMAPVWESHIKALHTRLWTDTLTGTQQNAKIWAGFLGLQHTLTADNVYGRVDRSTVSALNPSSLNAASDLATDVVSLSLLRKINNGFTKQDGSKFIGLAERTSTGMGATCIITTSELWQSLADEIESRYQIEVGDMPKHGLGGFKSPVLFYDNCYITWDPYCPDGELYALDLDSWLVEVDPRHNVRFLGLVDKSQTEQGGEYVEWGNISTKLRLTNESPWTNCRVYNLIAA